jgi:hypothetical protein
MKIENNRALAAEKKTYEIPSVVLTQMMPSVIICVSGGSGNIDLGGGGGGSFIPD